MRGAQLIGPARRGQAPPVQDDDILEQVLDLIDLVGGDDDGGPLAQIQRQQLVPEAAPHHDVHAQVDLIQQQDGAVAGQGEDGIQRAALPQGQARGPGLQGELEDLHEPSGLLSVPAGPGRGPQFQGAASGGVLEEGAGPAQEGGGSHGGIVVEGGAPRNREAPGGGAAQPGDEGQQSRLA